MELKKVEINKFLAIFLVVILLAVNTVVSFAGGSSDTVAVPSQSSGLYANLTDIRGGTGIDKTAPVITEGGVDGSYALKAGTDSADFTRYLFGWRFAPSARASLPKKTPITVEMQVKLVSGNVKALYAGHFYSVAPKGDNNTNYTTEDKYSSADLSAEEYRTLTFTYEATENYNSQYVFINMTSSGGKGAVILIDNVKVYLADDEQKTNLLIGASLMMDAGNTAYDGGNRDVGSFDIIKMADVPFDNSPIEGVRYLPLEKIGYRTATVAPKASAEGEGVKGSYAMELGVDGKKLNEITFQGANRTGAFVSLESGYNYTVEFKIKLKSGTVSSFSVGMMECEGYSTTEFAAGGTLITDETSKHFGKWYYTGGTEYFYTLSGVDVENEWKFFRCEIKANRNDGNWKRLALKLVGESADTAVLIDELQIYRSDDENKTLIQYDDELEPTGLFDVVRNSYTSKKYEDSDTDYKYVPIRFTDWGFDTKEEIVSNINSAVPKIFNDGISASGNRLDEHNLIKPRLAEGEGIGGSYALVLGDDSVKNVNNYSAGFCYLGGTGALDINTKYTFNVKIKKQGTVDRLSIGFMEKSIVHYSFIALNNELDEDWVEYTWEYTTTDEGIKAWNYLYIAYSSLDGAKIYIDELNVYKTDDALKHARFPYGNFDYIDNGQAEKVNLSEEFPDGVAADMGTVNGNSDVVKTGVKARVMNCIEGDKSNGVLAFGFDSEKEAHNNYYKILNSTKPGGSYKISFKVLVQGEIDWAYIGFINSWQRYDYYGEGYTFNQYEHGKWTYVEYTVTDPADWLTGEGYRGIHIDFKGPAGTGMLIDDFKVTYVPMGDNAPNIFGNGSFEKQTDITYDNKVWSDIFIKREGE